VRRAFALIDKTFGRSETRDDSADGLPPLCPRVAVTMGPAGALVRFTNSPGTHAGEAHQCHVEKKRAVDSEWPDCEFIVSSRVFLRDGLPLFNAIGAVEGKRLCKKGHVERSTSPAEQRSDVAVTNGAARWDAKSETCDFQWRNRSDRDAPNPDPVSSSCADREHGCGSGRIFQVAIRNRGFSTWHFSLNVAESPPSLPLQQLKAFFQQ